MCAPCVFAIVDRYIAVSLEFYMDEGVSRRSSLNLGHLVDKGRGHTSSPHVLPCVCQIRDRTRVSSYLSLRARIIFIDSFLRKLPRDASWETCQSSAGDEVSLDKFYKLFLYRVAVFSRKELDNDSPFDKK